ncbi:hypothetical protein, partial [Rickettsiella grylli]|uniref:hypothetical protein n=1 Tax=Rickettsiella grylli TaxID=59196 RepID=UPI00117B7AB4
MFSKNKTNPWVVDDRENSRLILHKKIYLDLEKKLNTIITKELEKKRVIKKLTKKAIRAEKKRLAQLLTTLLKQEGVDKWNEEAIAHLDWNTFYNQFIILNALDLNDAATQKKIKKYFKDNSKKIPGFFLQKEDLVRIYSTVSIWERINQ